MFLLYILFEVHLFIYLWLIHFSLKYSSSSLSDYITIYLSILLLMDLWPILQHCYYSRSHIHVLVYGFSRVVIGSGQLDSGKCLYTSLGNTNLFWSACACQHLLSHQVRWECPLFHILSILLNFCISGKCGMVLHCGFNLYFCNY